MCVAAVSSSSGANLFFPSYILVLFSLEKMGALQWNNVVYQNQGWRLVTCIWLHAGLIHLLANLFSLLFIGVRLEQQFGFGECWYLIHWISACLWIDYLSSLFLFWSL